jgi:pre-mRNA-splicing factor SYF1
LELYVRILNDEGFVSKRGASKSRYQLWMELCEFIARSPLRCVHLATAAGGPDQLIRHALRRYTDEVGRLWICLADYHLRQGLFGRAREIFEEAIASVATARDFGIVFNAYMKFEEQMVEAEIEEIQEDDEEGDDATEIE